MIVGVTAGSFAWRDLEEAFSRAIDDWGFDLIEFDAARLGPIGCAQSGLLAQRFGASVGLHAALDPAPGSSDLIGTALADLRVQCEDALAQYARISLPWGTAPLLAGPSSVQAVLPDYEAAGIRLLLPFGAGGERERAAIAATASGFWLDLDQVAGAIDAMGTDGAKRAGGVLVSIDDVQGSERVRLLRRLRDLGFRAPCLLAAGGSSGADRLRSGAERLREILAGN